MTTVSSIWIQLAACAMLIGLAGPPLSRSADVIAHKTGLSGSWIGLVLLATVTSLPELATGISAVTVAAAPNIAVGDVLGSCVFNLVILAVLDFLQRGEPVYRRARQGHILSAGFGVVLIGFVGMNLLPHAQGAVLAIAHVGVYAPAIFLFYGLAMRMIFVYERVQFEEFTEESADRYPGMTLRGALLRYAMCGAVVVGAGAWLPFVGADLADAMGWQKSFVGTLFVAGATSLPELVVTIAAWRIGALNMAIANLLGSNLVNIFILAIDDIFFLPGPLLSRVSPAHAVSAMSAVVMNGIVIIGLLYRPSTRLLKSVGWVSLGLFTVYLLNSYVLYLHGE